MIRKHNLSDRQFHCRFTFVTCLNSAAAAGLRFFVCPAVSQSEWRLVPLHSQLAPLPVVDQYADSNNVWEERCPSSSCGGSAVSCSDAGSGTSSAAPCGELRDGNASWGGVQSLAEHQDAGSAGRGGTTERRAKQRCSGLCFWPRPVDGEQLHVRQK